MLVSLILLPIVARLNIRATETVSRSHVVGLVDMQGCLESATEWCLPRLRSRWNTVTHKTSDKACAAVLFPATNDRT